MKAIALLLLAAFAAHAAPRDWTAADGRVINADYLGRAADGSALVLERTDTKARVTVPVAALSATDQTFAATLPTTAVPEPPPAKLAGPSPTLIALASKWPALGSTHSDAENLKKKYQKDIDAILSGNPAQNCRTLMLRIERDLPIVKNEASISISPDDQYSEKGRAKIAKRAAAEASIAWLKAISTHCGKIEVLASKE